MEEEEEEEEVQILTNISNIGGMPCNIHIDYDIDCGYATYE